MPEKSLLQQPGTSAEKNPGLANNRRLPPSTDDKLARHGDLPTINDQLLEAAWHGSYDVVKALLDRGADPRTRDSGHFTALHFATRNSNDQTVLLLNCLLNHGADLNALTALNRTPLQCAVICGNLSAINTLLEHGADPDIPDQFGFTPLNKAVAQGDRLIVDKLLAHSANPDKFGVWTLNPLYKAVFKGYTDIVQTLLAHGANPDPDLCNTSGRTMLNCLVEKLRPVAEVSLMLANGADPNTCSNSGQTMLNFVIDREDCPVPLLKLLLANGADPNARGEDGDTPLHLGVANKSLEFVKVLMENGADPGVRNSLGWTALKSAEADGNVPEIIDQLRQYVPVYQPGSLKACARTCIRQRLVKNRTLLADVLSTASDCLPLKASLKAYVYKPLAI
ncbi:ankyrin repeat domain-containing protein [Endozoicomonas sp. ONNA2]|uniref:ankyrin repeat domain-containing protein n=1 Tax=Endozoicomonas sp. ONNA2 TaxID=2828741 RepID=UPI0021493431|nr:ankyrin repeat domain-containing protein [Endozoicomonas sp. ONNA2]